MDFDDSHPDNEQNEDVIPKKLKQIFDFIDMMKSHVDISRDFHVDTWADVEFLACHAEKRIPGLGTELIARGVQKLQEMGIKVRTLSFHIELSYRFKVVTVHASSYFSSRIFINNDFRPIFSQKFEDYKIKGDVIFPTEEPHTMATLFVKTL